jgi:hypothetical protein
MKTLLSLSLALALCAAGSTSRAAEPVDPHKGHHPAPAAVDPQAPVAPAQVAEHKPGATDSHAQHQKVDAQLGRMRAMHDQMAKATTPAERDALMAEHMQVMQDGMKMMHEMSAPPMAEGAVEGGMPPGAMAGDGAKAGMHDHMGPGMKANHDAMHQRMQMMESMMQMMMDRLADPSAHQ